MDNKTCGAGPVVGIIMGSDSDWTTMRSAAEVLDNFIVPYEKRVVSAHRTPDDLFDYAEKAEGRGLALIIAGAGGAAHLPGMTASKTIVPVVGVPVIATPLRGLDALLSILQMPAGVGVATVGVGSMGAKHAAQFALAALAARSSPLRDNPRSLDGAANSRDLAADGPATVAILAQDEADLEVLHPTEQYLARLEVKYKKVISPESSSQALKPLLGDLKTHGAAIFIAGSRGGVGFALAVAKATALPVLNVPIVAEPVDRVDEFLQPFIDMPPGLATFAIGKPGAINTALFAATVISGPDSPTWRLMRQMRDEQVKRVQAMKIR